MGWLRLPLLASRSLSFGKKDRLYPAFAHSVILGGGEFWPDNKRWRDQTKMNYASMIRSAVWSCFESFIKIL